MGKPITIKNLGVCYAFPDLCWTTLPLVGKVPVPYTNIGQLSDVEDTADSVKVNGESVVTSNSSISSTTGDEAGVEKGLISEEIGGKVEFVSYSMTVKAEGHYVVRLGDITTQNDGNAVGTVLGGFPTVLVGG
jgi:hypothetical protein